MIHIYDGNNYYRKVLESDPTGFAPRKILTDFINDPQPLRFWCWDGFGGNARRRAIYPQYKTNRTELDRTFYDGFKTLGEILQWAPVAQVKVPNYEADDVIASLARFSASEGNEVAVYSNDMDFAQLSAEYPAKVFCGYREKMPASLVKLYKICVGDSSDKISGIPGFGEKTWDAVDKADLAHWVSAILYDKERPNIGLPARVHNVDGDLVKALDRVVSFYDVPLALIQEHTTFGKSDYQSADAYLKRFLS